MAEAYADDCARCGCARRARSPSVCALLSGSPGGVALLVINTDRAANQSLQIPTSTEGYTLSAEKLEGTRLRLNGNELTLGADDVIPQLTGVQTPAGRLTFEPATITFLAVPNANNGNCR